MARLHVWIEGRVHGVLFRDSTRRVALDARLGGWVRNLPDGRVEAVFEGERAACERALAFVRVGPPAAHVDGVEADWDEPEEGLEGFDIRF